MKYTKLVLSAVSVTLVLTGCNIGMAPAGMSREEAKAALDKMSPRDQIRYVASSPMPPEQKQQRYKEIEAKTGVKAADVLGGAPNTGAGGPGTAPAGN